MASYKEDEREAKAQDEVDDTALLVSQAIQGMERNYAIGANADSTRLRKSVVDIANIPNFILGKPVAFVRIPMPKIED